MKRLVCSFLGLLGLSACASGSVDLSETGAGDAWAAWQIGEFEQARKLAEASVSEAGDDARYVLTLAAHMTGKHEQAIAARRDMSSSYKHLDVLDEPVLYSYAHSGRAAEGLAFGRSRSLRGDGYTRALMTLMADQPMTILYGPAEQISFTDDKLSPLMPGFGITVNGAPVVARLDTGGSWLVMTESQAKAHGIQPLGCTTGAFNMQSGKVCVGAADMAIGRATLKNVPVTIVYGMSAAASIAEHFGVELGPIVGTNLLRAFFTTIDGPGNRIILSNPHDNAARLEHLSHIQTLDDPQTFGVWTSHYMFADVWIGEAQTSAFLDTGIVMAGENDEQVAFLLPDATLKTVSSEKTSKVGVFRLSSDVRFAGTKRFENQAYRVTNKQWAAGFPTWGTSNHNALLSWGYFKHFTWTLDFETQEMWLE